MVRAFRGAITVRNNDKDEILSATGELYDKIVKANGLDKEDFVCIFFSLTPDLDKVFPARAVRDKGVTDVPLMCMAEIPVEGALQKCVRILILSNSEKSNSEIKHIYLKDAVKLRPDLAKQEEGMKKFNVAIDGPAGAGKSSISKAVAKKLGCIYVDTGAMYRACALYAIEENIPITAEGLSGELDNIKVGIKYTEDGQRIYLADRDVSERIREPDVSIGASDIAVIPAVRLKLVELQRELAAKESVVMDGRDIGTYVLPDAEVKIFLTASVDERAKRRLLELETKGQTVDFESVKQDMMYRDKNDSEREFAPLRQADDAIYLDTTALDFDAVVKKVLDIIEKAVG